MDENLKQKFVKMLAYQKKDVELRRLNDTINRDEALVSMNKNKRAFNEAKQAISDCDSQAAGLTDMYGELQKYIDDNEALLAELEGVEETDEQAIEARVKKLESLRSKFQSADKKVHDIEGKAKSLCARRADALKTGNAARQRFNDARDKHGKLVNSKADELNKLKSELQAMRAELDSQLYEEYKKLVDDNKFPPIALAVAGDDKKNMFNCGGCGLSLPQKGNATLKEKGWCRCENCRRIIVHLN